MNSGLHKKFYFTNFICIVLMHIIVAEVRFSNTLHLGKLRNSKNLSSVKNKFLGV